jgi:hypothetical protein
VTPVVSVIIPAWNAAATLAETVRSAAAQSHSTIEILIVDDGSTDATRSIAEGLAAADPRIRVLAQPNAGVAAARNAGLAQARGAWAAWLDADDLWHPAKLARQLAAAAAAPRPPAFIYTGYRMIDAADVVGPLPRTLADVSGHTLCQQIATTYFTNVSSFMAPIELARACGGHDSRLRDNGVEGAEDLLLQLRLAMRGPASCIPEALVGYRMHGANMSRAIARAARSNLLALQWIQDEAPEVPSWVFAHARARTIGFGLQMLAAGNAWDGIRFIAGRVAQDPLRASAMLARAVPWVAQQAFGGRPTDPATGSAFASADPATVPFEGHMLVSRRTLRSLAEADAARMSAGARHS